MRSALRRCVGSWIKEQIIDLQRSSRQWSIDSALVWNPRQPGLEVLVLAALQACSKALDLDLGKKIHRDAIQDQIDARIFVANTLISMYAKCGVMDEAIKVFRGIQVPSIVSWNALILGYAENAQEDLALDLFRRAPGPNARTFAAAARACSGLASREGGEKVGDKILKAAALGIAREIYALAGKMGFESEVFVASAFVDLFARCGSMPDSRQAFDNALDRDQVCWNALMLGYVDNGEEHRALELFSTCVPNARSFVAAIRACSAAAKKEQGQALVDRELVKPESLRIGMDLHARASDLGHDNEGFVASTLIDMYIKCGSLHRAREVFDQVSNRSQVAWNSLILGYAENGDEHQALELFSRMDRCRHDQDARTFVAALKACSNLAERDGGELVRGKLLKVLPLEKVMGIHIRARNAGCDTDVFVASALVDAYGRCCSMLDARRIFDKMPVRTVVSWTALIRGYADNDGEDLAIELFRRMPGEGCTATVWSFVAVLQACGGLAAKCRADEKVVVRGILEDILSQARGVGVDADVFLLCTLVDAYVKCGSVRDARDAFDRMRNPDTVAWNALILGYAENGDEVAALELYASVPEKDRDARTYVAALKACSVLALKEDRDVDEGIASRSIGEARKIQAGAARLGFGLDVFVTTTLVDTYAKCGSMKDSRRVYDRVPAHSAAIWTALLLGYVENWDEAAVLEMLDSMPIESDAQAFVVALKACANLAAREEISRLIDGSFVKVRTLERGSDIRRRASKCGLESDTLVANSLVDFYVKCWSLVDARRVFDSLENKNVVGWNAILRGYTKAGEERFALELLLSMDCAPDLRTFIAGVKACTGLAGKEDGIKVDGKLYKIDSIGKAFWLHRRSEELGGDSDVFLASSLIECYARCGSLIDALRIFERMPRFNVLIWNALMIGYVENGEAELGLELLSSMVGCNPNAQSYVAAIKACTVLAAGEEAKLVDGKMIKVEALSRGKIISSAAVKDGFGSVGVIASALLNLYAKCRSPANAREVFEGIAAADRDVVLWNTLILCYVDNGEEELALKAFATMKSRENRRPDAGSFVAVLKACGNIASVEAARLIHAEIVRSGAENYNVSNSIVDVYGKCGSMIDAQIVFDSLATRDAVTWNSLLAGYSHHSSSSKVFGLFHQMRDEDLDVNSITFVSLLTACSHAGLADEARRCLDSMTCVYGIRPGMEHYHCVVDALGRANQLDAAVAVVRSMSLSPSALTWFTVLAACQKWNDVDRARVAMEELLRAPGSDAVADSAHLLMEKLTRH